MKKNVLMKYLVLMYSVLGLFLGFLAPVFYLMLVLVHNETAISATGIIDEANRNSSFQLMILIFPISTGGLGFVFALYRQKIEELVLETRYRTNIFHAINDILLIVNLRGIIVKVNDACIKEVGFTRKELIGQHLEMILNDYGVREANELLLKFDEKGEFSNLKARGLKSNQEHFMTIMNITIVAESEHISNYIVSLKNINDLEIIENKFNGQQKLAFESAKFASLGVLAAGIGHEINNPLGIIQMANDLMEKRLSQLGIVDERLKKKIILKNDCVSRISKLIDGLRVMASSDEKGLTVINAETFLISTIDIVKEIFEKKNVVIHLVLEADGTFIEGDGNKIQQILMNLLNNASDAMENSRGEITVRTSSDDQCFSVFIKDNGKGMEESEIKQAFDTFFTTKEVGHGTGMGLSITKQLVREMNGNIEISSVLTEGSEFHLSFPLYQGEEYESKYIDGNSTGSKAVDKDKVSINVILAEDEAPLREMCAEILMDFGCHVDQVSNGALALNLIHSRNYDLLITDMQMPELSGGELIDKIKLDSELKIKIIVMTGGVNVEFDKESFQVLENQVDAIINKPFRKEEIYTVVKELF